MESTAMALTATDGVSTYVPPPPPPRPEPQPGPAPTPVSSYRPEPTYSPLQATPSSIPTGPSGVGGTQYGIPTGSTLSGIASGTQAQPFDVTMSQLATAVYGTRGPAPEGWSAVSDQQLIDRGIQDPQAWREQFLGADETLPADQQNLQEFRAEVYTDGQGNFVLSYRGTAEGGADWDNNFTQGTGFETPDGDKFSVTAVNTAMEFERVFGNNAAGDSSNLAITGHSQGGGLATVGSLASGVPAVTFDGSGIHPNTFDRMGIDPAAARELAENGQIRAYSLAEDALTNAQDSWVTGLLAPDALGTQIVVNPAARDANNMFTHYGPIENVGNAPLVNAGVELARSPLGDLILPGIAPLVGNLAYSAISHNPNALTAGMVENQPWQAGYENPSNLGRDLQNLLPDVAKDDYARNLHDLITDVQDVAATQFAQGDYVQGTVNILGDLAEGAFNSTGDTVDGYADSLAATLDDGIDGWMGDALSFTVGGTGDLFEFGTDALGQTTEWVADGTGWVAQGVTDGAAAVGDFLNPFN
jgi:hypothetical protein